MNRLHIGHDVASGWIETAIGARTARDLVARSLTWGIDSRSLSDAAAGTQSDTEAISRSVG